MKTNKIIFVIISLAVLAAILFLMIYQPGAGMYIRADKLLDPPEKYVEISLLELEEYPYVKEAVMNAGKDVKLPFDHTESVTKFITIIRNNETENIKVNDGYYKIFYYSAD